MKLACNCSVCFQLFSFFLSAFLIPKVVKPVCQKGYEFLAWETAPLSVSSALSNLLLGSDIPPLPSCDLFSFHDKSDCFRWMISEVHVISRNYREKMDLSNYELPASDAVFMELSHLGRDFTVWMHFLFLKDIIYNVYFVTGCCCFRLLI